MTFSLYYLCINFKIFSKFLQFAVKIQLMKNHQEQYFLFKKRIFLKKEIFTGFFSLTPSLLPGIIYFFEDSLPLKRGKKDYSSS